MLQIPIVALQRSPLVKGQALFNVCLQTISILLLPTPVRLPLLTLRLEYMFLDLDDSWVINGEDHLVYFSRSYR